MTEEELFHQALERPASERAAFLLAACGDDLALRQRVEVLLQAHANPGSFLQGGSPAFAPTIDQPTVSEGPGTAIGPYKLLEPIGEGGFGVVFLAEQQQPVRRKVALKVIKPGMDTRQVIARFEAERQALAIMDHPNIAKVLDGGATASGRPYFVMELVRGIPITAYCDQHQLDPQKRLELFVTVCQAVQHAHSKGIIHRDIKPSNVLIALVDDKPVVKVIDFGIAKATTGQLTDKTLFTSLAQMIGTPLYMSPEQAGLSGLDIDTRSDIYSLGVLLYELLTGTTPFEKHRLQQAAYEEVRRIIREEEPPKPSTRLSDLSKSSLQGRSDGSSQAGPTSSLASISAQRHIEPATLTKLVRGDLDWIVMKALEKDRARRYETANGFAADVLRYLHDEPVTACPPSAAYRFRKFARRNKGTLTTATVVAVALIAGTVISTWQAIRATRAEGLAQTRFLDEQKARREAEKARRDEAKARRQAEVARKNEAEARRLAEENFNNARQAVEDYFTLVSESTLLDVPGLQPLRKALLETALGYYQGMLEQRGDDPTALADSAVAYLRLGNVYHEVDRNDDCQAAMEAALDVVDRLRRQHPGAIEAHRRLAGYWKVHRGMSPRTRMPKDPVAAARVLTRFLELWQAFAKENPSSEGFQNDLAAINMLLGALEGGRGWAGDAAGYGRAAEHCRAAVAIWEQLGKAQPEVRSYRENLAFVYGEMSSALRHVGRHEEANVAKNKALALYEELAAEFPDVPTYREALATNIGGLGIHLAGDGRRREAEDAYLRSLDLLSKLADEFPWVQRYTEMKAGMVQHLLTLSPQAGPEGIEFFTRAIDKVPTAARLWLARGKTYLALKQPENALADFSMAIQLGVSDPDAPWWHLERSYIYTSLEQPDKALADLSYAVQRWPNLWDAWVWRGGLHYARQEWAEAISDYDRGLGLNPKYWPGWWMRGVAAARLVRWAVALESYDKALALNPEGPDYPNDLAWLLATCPDASLRNPARAVEMAQKVTEKEPQAGRYWITLGAAQYRAGQWQAAVQALDRAVELGWGNASALFFLAMSHWQLDQKDEARASYDKAVQWMEANGKDNEELIRFRAEAATLLGIADTDPNPPPAEDASSDSQQ